MSVATVMWAAVFIIAAVWPVSQAHCVYDSWGHCMYQCPPDTVSYVSPCGTGETMSQRTCREPVARSVGVICDLSRCDCPETKVWDEVKEKCVLLEDCSDQTIKSSKADDRV